MKSVIFVFVALCTLIIGSAAWGSKASNDARKQKQVVNFDRAVVLQGVTLKGEYLFVHDDAAMARGQDCTYVYSGNAEVRSNLVVSFHCVPVERAKVRNFITRTNETSPGVIELREFQFAGDTEAHGVPIR